MHRIVQDMFLMSEGWVYCMSNPAMPGMLKIGESGVQELEQRQKKLSSDTGVPLPFVIEFAIYVANRKEKEASLHTFLSDKRVNPKREFFYETPDRIKILFSLMDGTWWPEVPVTEPMEIEHVEPVEPVKVKATKPLKLWARPSLNDILHDGQQVFHTGACPNEWIGTYTREHNAIMYNSITYTPNHFARTHYETERPDRKPDCNAWKECKVMKDGTLVALGTL